MKMPFEDNTFDVVYEIEATAHAPTKLGVYSEAFRVLKPGGYFLGYEWAFTKNVSLILTLIGTRKLNI
jgi:sterol 24-C-methyltransferase